MAGWLADWLAGWAAGQRGSGAVEARTAQQQRGLQAWLLHQALARLPLNSTTTPPPPPLPQECEDLMARGVSGTGSGFDAPAAGKVGGRFVGRADDVPAHRLRELGAQAAEARLRRQAVMPAGPRTLGGWLKQAWLAKGDGAVMQGQAGARCVHSLPLCTANRACCP